MDNKKCKGSDKDAVCHITHYDVLYRGENLMENQNVGSCVSHSLIVQFYNLAHLFSVLCTLFQLLCILLYVCSFFVYTVLLFWRNIKDRINLVEVYNCN